MRGYFIDATQMVDPSRVQCCSCNVRADKRGGRWFVTNHQDSDGVSRKNLCEECSCDCLEGVCDTDNIYTRNGYKNREDYLRRMADDYGVPPTVVFEVAGMLGESEDFDGLVTSLEDFAAAGLLGSEA